MKRRTTRSPRRCLATRSRLGRRCSWQSRCTRAQGRRCTSPSPCMFRRHRHRRHQRRRGRRSILARSSRRSLIRTQWTSRSWFRPIRWCRLRCHSTRRCYRRSSLPWTRHCRHPRCRRCCSIRSAPVWCCLCSAFRRRQGLAFRRNPPRTRSRRMKRSSRDSKRTSLSKSFAAKFSFLASGRNRQSFAKTRHFVARPEWFVNEWKVPFAND